MRFAYWELFTLLFISWSCSVTYECEISTIVRKMEFGWIINYLQFPDNAL